MLCGLVASAISGAALYVFAVLMAAAIRIMRSAELPR